MIMAERFETKVFISCATFYALSRDGFEIFLAYAVFDLLFKICGKMALFEKSKLWYFSCDKYVYDVSKLDFGYVVAHPISVRIIPKSSKNFNALVVRRMKIRFCENC